MTRLVLISAGERVAGKPARPDISIRAGDSLLASTDPIVVDAVTGVDIALNALGQRAADHMSYVDRRDAMEDLDAHGLVSRDAQPHPPSKVRTFATAVFKTLRQ